MKRANGAGVNQDLAQSLYRAASGTVGGIVGCVLWEGGRSVLGLFTLTVLLCLGVVVSFR